MANSKSSLRSLGSSSEYFEGQIGFIPCDIQVSFLEPVMVCEDTGTIDNDLVNLKTT